MTISEFKAYLDGLEAGLAGNPITPEQWEALKAKLALVEAPAATQPSA